MYAHSSQERETGALTPFLSMTEINSVNRAVVKDFFFRFLRRVTPGGIREIPKRQAEVFGLGKPFPDKPA